MLQMGVWEDLPLGPWDGRNPMISSMFLVKRKPQQQRAQMGREMLER
jgi:hypothetical protein